MSERDAADAAMRIVVAFDAAPPGEAALETAIGLAAALGIELAGLFVEDLDLVRMAELPFTRELGLASVVTRPIGPADLERALRLQAESSRKWLESAASALNLRWSFEVVRGRAPAAVLEYAIGPGFVVFGTALYGSAARGACPSAPPGVHRRARGERFRSLHLRPIAVLFDGSERAWRALSAAHALAATAGTRLVLLVAADGAGEFERLRDEVRSWLVERGAMARFLRLRSRGAADVVQAAKAEGAAALLWCGAAVPADRETLRALLAALGCPLVLIT